MGQFHALEELKGEIEALQTTIDALRTIRELDEWIESTRQPVLALERRLEVAGDVNNLRPCEVGSGPSSNCRRPFEACESLWRRTRP